MAKYTLDPTSTVAQLIGELDIVKIQMLIGVSLPCKEIYVYPGAIKHIKKNHEQIFNQYHHLIPDIIDSPDYIGQNPKEPSSVELYKIINDTLLVAIKLDPSGYLYLSSFYDLNNAAYKIIKRLKSGRIVKYI